MDARIQDTKKHQLSALHHTSIRVGHGGIDRGVGWFHELFVRTVSETVNIGSFFFLEESSEQNNRKEKRGGREIGQTAVVVGAGDSEGLTAAVCARFKSVQQVKSAGTRQEIYQF